MAHIIKDIPAVSDDLIDKFRKQSSATVHEAMDKRGAMDFKIKPIKSGTKVCGQAITVKVTPGDNLMVAKAVSMAKKNQVIVIDYGNVQEFGPFGEVLAVECVSKGVAGLVTNGSVRDSKEISKLNFPVFGTGLCIIGTSKSKLGTINHPISCGNVIVNPGDIILGDDDGVVVVPIDEAEKVLADANLRDAKELEIMERLRQGETLFDIYEYQKIFNELGCIEE